MKILKSITLRKITLRNKSQTFLTAVLASVFSFSSVAYGEEKTVLQKDKAFSIDKLEIKVGDTIHFRNEDPFFHNVFSLSDAKFFDLGSFPKGESRPVTFDQAGTVEIECAIHPNMKMVVEVK